MPTRDLRTALARHGRAGLGPFYLQRFIEHPGRDLGVAVLDGQCLGAYWRVAGARSVDDDDPGGWAATSVLTRLR